MQSGGARVEAGVGVGLDRGVAVPDGPAEGVREGAAVRAEAVGRALGLLLGRLLGLAPGLALGLALGVLVGQTRASPVSRETMLWASVRFFAAIPEATCSVG